MRGGRLAACTAAGCALLLAAARPAAPGASDEGAAERMGHVAVPARIEASEPLRKRLTLPDGFELGVFAGGLGHPRMMAVGEDGTVYVTRPDRGDVVALRDRDGDGAADEVRPAVSGLPGVHGVAVREGRLYLAAPTRVFVADLRPGGAVGPPRLLAGGLPEGGRHPNRTLAFGPDGLLYVSVGSRCNACREANGAYATILVMGQDGETWRVFARGLRNTIGFGWHPETGQMWGMDQGTDWRGDDTPPEELNRIEADADYGWPLCYGDRRPDPYVPGQPEGEAREASCASTRGPVLAYQAHSSPIGLVFYDAARFPPEYRGDAFVAMHGSWNRMPPTGYRIVRVRFMNGWPVRIEDFLTGFLLEDERAQFSRPAGLAVARDGSLLVSDDANGFVYRVAYVAGGPPGVSGERRR